MFRQYLLISIALFTFIIGTFSHARSGDIEWYQDGKESIAKKNWDAYETFRDRLKDSPLLPYLEYYYYEALIDHLSPELTLEFIKQYPDRVFTRLLKNKLFSNELNKKNYSFILKNSDLYNTQELRCMYYEAQLNRVPELFDSDTFKEEWINTLSLPKSCRSTEHHWLSQEISGFLLKKKIYERLNRNYITRSRELFPYLSEKDQQFYDHIITLLQNPPAIKNVKNFYNDSSRYYALVIDRWSKQNSVAAQDGLNYLQSKHVLNQEDYIKLRNQLAVFQAGRSDAIKPLERIKNIPESERDDQVRQWGFRLAAQRGECALALSLLTGMSSEAQNTPTWGYWKGEMYECTNQHPAAVAEYKKIAHEPSFYGFLAADKLSSQYTVLNKMVRDPIGSTILPTNIKIRSGLLLSSANEEYFARSEWFSGIRELNQYEKHAASIYAHQQHLYDFSIRAAIMAKAEGGLSFRYPSNYVAEIEQNINQEWLSKYVVLGLIRQESLFHEKAKSHANAYGLMQLLIPTAERMSQKLNESARRSLYHPDANIRYGITYLEHLSESVGPCLPYILASYNAGPNKVREWIWREEQPNMVLWIESIPYHETRNYVKTVLENAIIYHHLNRDSERISHYLKCNFE